MGITILLTQKHRDVFTLLVVMLKSSWLASQVKRNYATSHRHDTGTTVFAPRSEKVSVQLAAWFRHFSTLAFLRFHWSNTVPSASILGQLGAV